MAHSVHCIVFSDISIQNCRDFWKDLMKVENGVYQKISAYKNLIVNYTFKEAPDKSRSYHQKESTNHLADCGYRIALLIFDFNDPSTLPSVLYRWSKFEKSNNIPVIMAGIWSNKSEGDLKSNQEIEKIINIIKPIDFHMFTRQNILQKDGSLDILERIASNALNYKRQMIYEIMTAETDNQAYSMIQRMMLSFSDVTECNKKGENISHVFARSRFNESFHLLFRKASRYSGERYLDENHFIRILLQQQDNSGNTAIMTAALHHNYDIVQKFVWLQNDDWLSTLIIQNSKGQNLFDILFTQCSTGTYKELSAALSTQLFKKAMIFKSDNESDQDTLEITKLFGMMKMIDILTEVNINLQPDDKDKTLRPFLLQTDENGNIPIIAAAINSIDSAAFKKLLIFYSNVDFSSATVVNSKGENFVHVLGRQGLADNIDALKSVVSDFKKRVLEENNVGFGNQLKFIRTLLITKTSEQFSPIISAVVSNNNNDAF